MAVQTQVTENNVAYAVCNTM